MISSARLPTLRTAPPAGHAGRRLYKSDLLLGVQEFPLLFTSSSVHLGPSCVCDHSSSRLEAAGRWSRTAGRRRHDCIPQRKPMNNVLYVFIIFWGVKNNLLTNSVEWESGSFPRKKETFHHFSHLSALRHGSFKREQRNDFQPKSSCTVMNSRLL